MKKKEGVNSARYVVLLFLLIAIPLCLFAGGAEETEKVTLNYVFWLLDPDTPAGWKRVHTGFIEENPDIEINYISVPGTGWGEYLDKVATMVAGGEKPDTMWLATEGLWFMHNKKIIVPLDTYFERDKAELQDFVDDVAPSLMEANKVDGEIYYPPYSWNNMVIWYNTKMLGEAGVAYPEEDWTRADFLEICKKVTKDRDSDGQLDQYGYPVEPGYFISTLPWLFSNRTSVISLDDYNRSDANAPKTVEVMQFMVDLIYKYKYSPRPGYGPIFNSFMSGDVSMVPAGRWPIMSFEPENFTDCDIQYWPKWTADTDRLTLFGIDGFPLMSTSQNKDKTWELIKYMTRKDVMSYIVGKEDAPLSNIPARKSLALGPGMGKFPPKNYKIFYESISKYEASAKGRPIPYTEMDSIWQSYCSLMFANELSVEEACQKAHEEIEAVLAKYK